MPVQPAMKPDPKIQMIYQSLTQSVRQAEGMRKANISLNIPTPMLKAFLEWVDKATNESPQATSGKKAP